MFQGKQIIALGDRDGIQGMAIAECLQSAGAQVALMSTECFVWTAAGAMDLGIQERIKELAEGPQRDALVVVIGNLDVGGAELAAETVTAGDPTWAGPLAGVPLGLPVYHVLEPEVKESVAPDVYEQHLSLMEMVLESDAPIQAVRAVRERT